MIVAVLGAGGFVGRHVVARLEAEGMAVRAIGGRSTLDVVTATPTQLAAALQGCQAVVNLIGIKRESGAQTFEAVHVGVVRKLIEAARTAGSRRIVHISVVVSRPDPERGYHDTKARAEAEIAASGLEWTILKPGVIYGAGDDMLSHLTKMIRSSPVFPVVGDGSSLLQPVAVEDVAAAVAASLRNPVSIEKRYDVVGPEAIRLRDIVRRVADALALRLRILPTPPWLMRPAVALMNRVMRNPLSTPSQLRMLIEGMTGDPGPLERDLGVRPRPFAVESIRPIVAALPDATRLDLRWGERWPTVATTSPVLLVVVAIAAMTTALRSRGELWTPLIAATTLMGVAGAASMWSERRDWFRAGWLDAALGLASAGLLYGMARLALEWGPLAGEASRLFAWKEGHSAAYLALTLPLLVVGEELFWRGAMLRGIAASCSKRTAVLVAATIAFVVHLPEGGWLLPAAAFGMSIAWGLLFVTRRSLVAPIACHLAFDAGMLLL